MVGLTKCDTGVISPCQKCRNAISVMRSRWKFPPVVSKSKITTGLSHCRKNCAKLSKFAVMLVY